MGSASPGSAAPDPLREWVSPLRADPYRLERPVDVAPEYGPDVLVGVAVLDQPASDIGKILGWIFETVHVLDWIKFRPPHRAQAEQMGEDPVQGHVVPVQGVRAERDVLDADEFRAVLEVIHHRLDAVPGMGVRQ